MLTSYKPSAGRHFIVDLWGAASLTDTAFIKQALIDAACAGQATLLRVHLHQFSDSGGITGMALLAESHISVHTWPERNYAAFDVFMCGDAKPEQAVALLIDVFKPARKDVRELIRGGA